MLKLCANISMLFNELPFLQRVQASAKHGFVAVECLFPYAFSIDDIAQALASADVPLVLINTAAGDWEQGDRGLACVASRQTEFRAAVLQALTYASGLGLPLVHVMAGRVPADVTLAEAEVTYVANLQWAAAEAQKVGVSLTIEAINPVDMPGYMLSNQVQALRLLELIGAQNVALQFDFFHCQKHEGNALAQFKSLVGSIAHVQIAGVPQRHEPNTGELDYGPIFAAIDASGYQGFVAAEYRPATSTEQGLAWMANLD